MKKSKIHKKSINKKILYSLIFCAIIYLSWFFAGDRGILKRQEISIIKSVKYFVTLTFFTDGSFLGKFKNNHLAEIDEKSEKFKLLIVAGHDEYEFGTKFKGIKESEINLKLAENLADFFKNNDKFEVTLVRERDGYNPIFSDYFIREEDLIKDFINKQKEKMSELARVGIVNNTGGVVHNSASAQTVLKLYGINKWANENNIDMVLHIHFNDDSIRDRKREAEGKYSGFAVYVPEAQYSNAKASKDVAETVFNQLAKFYPVSDFLQEKNGIVEDQKLIAIGANNTLDSVGMLIEYGYIYESQFSSDKIRGFVIKDLAFQTYIGIVNFFETDKKLLFKYDTFLLPYRWEETLRRGVKNNESVLALQSALVFEKLYPPEGFDKRECPITGNFGDCTFLALKNFQKKYGIDNETDEVGELTKNKLNEIYSR